MGTILLITSNYVVREWIPGKGEYIKRFPPKKKWSGDFSPTVEPGFPVQHMDRFRPQETDSAHLLSFLLQCKIEQQGDSCSAAPASNVDSSQTPRLMREFNSVLLTPLWFSLSVLTPPPSHSLAILSFCQGNYVSRDALFSPWTDRLGESEQPSCPVYTGYTGIIIIVPPFPLRSVCGSQVARTLYGYIYTVLKI